MAQSPRPSTPADFLVAALFGVTGATLLVIAVVAEGKWPCWIIGPVLLVFCGLAAVPEWRSSFGSGLGKITVKTDLVTVETGAAAPAPAIDQPEKPAEEVLPPDPKLRAAASREPDPDILEALKTVDDPLAHWSVAIGLLRTDNAGMARQVITHALERFPDHPKLLILSGYLGRSKPRGAQSARPTAAKSSASNSSWRTRTSAITSGSAAIRATRTRRCAPGSSRRTTPGSSSLATRS